MGGIAAIPQGLQGSSSLKELSLDQCSLADTGLLLLGEALTTNVSLEILDVDRNDFTHDGLSVFRTTSTYERPAESLWIGGYEK